MDNIDNKVGTDYAGWPDRIYAIKPDGTIGFKSGPGPGGFQPDDLAAYLKQAVGAPDAAAAPAAAPTPVMPAAGSVPPALEAAALSGNPISLAALKGKVTLIDFWATWCPSCKASIPELVKVYNKDHARGLEIIGVSLDGPSTGTTIATARQYAAEHGMAWPQVCDGLGWDSPIVTRYGVSSLTTNVLVGKDGKVIGTGLSGDSLEKAIDAALAQP